MRNFLYNFDRFWSNRTKITNLRSKVSAKERLLNLRLYM
jgi:hypothetical protein